MAKRKKKHKNRKWGSFSLIIAVIISGLTFFLMSEWIAVMVSSLGLIMSTVIVIGMIIILVAWGGLSVRKILKG